MAVGPRLMPSGLLISGTKVAAPKKSLGQHWLTDRDILSLIADSGSLTANDTVLEIGPGLGTLTSELLRRAGKVVAVELDGALARKLPGQFPGTELEVINQDILTFDLSLLPKDYIVVANVPYYITAKIVKYLLNSSNSPKTIVLLVQKEVAERLAAKPGDLSILAISAQVYAEVSLDVLVPAHYFTPPPKVNSQVVVMHRRNEPLLKPSEERAFFRIVKAGFSSKRKKLRSSLSAGLNLSKDEVDQLLSSVGIDSNRRAEDLSVNEWKQILHNL